MKKYFFYFLVAGCFAANLTSTPPLTGSGNHYHQYIMATYNYHKGNTTQAHEAFQSLFTARPSTYAYVGYVPLLFEMGQYSAIATIIPYLDPLMKDHMGTQLLFVQSLELNGNQADAHKKSLELSLAFPNNSEIVYQVVRGYIFQEKFDAALKSIDTYLSQSSFNPLNYLFYYLQGQIYTALNQFNKAEEAVKKSIAIHYRFEQAWLLLGLIYEIQQKNDLALSTYKEYLSSIGQSATILEQKNTLTNHMKKKISHSNITKKNKVSSLFHSLPKKLSKPWNIQQKITA